MEHILTYDDAGVRTLTFNRGERRNAITRAMYETLIAQLRDAVADASIRVVLLQGDVTVFTAGNDIEDFQRQADDPEPVSTWPVTRFIRVVARFPKPLLAAVCGPAVGVGATLLLHCDLVYAGDNAQLSLPFVNLGLVPEAASSLLLPRLIGYQRSAEAFFTGAPITAEAALEVGLVNRVLPPMECNAYAAGQARRLAEKPRLALMETKRLLKAQVDQLDRCMDEEIRVFARMLQEPASREAFEAFLEKRAPDFSDC